MSDGSTRGMMKGCLGTFVKDVCARQSETALKARTDFERKKAKYISRWDQQICDTVDALRSGQTTIESLRRVCQDIAFQKKAWMRSKGYCR